MRRWAAAGGRALEFEPYVDWDGVRFPTEIRILDEDGPLAVLRVVAVAPARDLPASAFSPEWARAGR